AGGREAGHGVGPDPLERGAGHGQGTGGADRVHAPADVHERVRRVGGARGTVLEGRSGGTGGGARRSGPDAGEDPGEGGRRRRRSQRAEEPAAAPGAGLRARPVRDRAAAAWVGPGGLRAGEVRRGGGESGRGAVAAGGGCGGGGAPRRDGGGGEPVQ